jgi:H+/Cl- antiporter ClcA
VSDVDEPAAAASPSGSPAPSPEGSTGAPPAAIPDPAAMIRGRQYRGLLVLSGLLGIAVSLACWCFLELTHGLQQWVYVNLPKELGLSPVPWWWPLPPLAVAGVLIAFAVARLPGRGGHEPSEGLKVGAPTLPVQLPGVMLAAVATISLGLVLGPEAPLIALGSGTALFLVGLSRRPLPNQAKLVVGAASAFAALATIFGSPIFGAVIIIEAAGLGGPTLPVILLPGLIAAGVGSLVFIGIGSLTGLSSSAYALPALTLPTYSTPTLTDFLWTIVLSLVAAAVVFLVIQLAGRVRRVVAARPFVLFPAAALLVGLIAVAFSEISGQPENAVLFSGQDAMAQVASHAGTVSVATLALLLVSKALAWGISLGAARGGPTFPALFLGLVGGLLASHLPGFAETPAVGVLVGAALVSMLRLPLSSIVLALLITHAGNAVAPLVIVGVAVAYIGTLTLSARIPPQGDVEAAPA